MLIRRLLSVNFYTYWVVMTLNYYPNKVGLAEIGFICTYYKFSFLRANYCNGLLNSVKVAKKRTFEKTTKTI